MDIENRVIRIITEHMGLSQGEVTMGSDKESLGVDSLDDVEILMILEEEFDIVITDSAGQRLKTVLQVASHITSALAVKAIAKDFVPFPPDSPLCGLSLEPCAPVRADTISITPAELKGYKRNDEILQSLTEFLVANGIGEVGEESITVAIREIADKHGIDVRSDDEKTLAWMSEYKSIPKMMLGDIKDGKCPWLKWVGE